MGNKKPENPPTDMFPVRPRRHPFAKALGECALGRARLESVTMSPGFVAQCLTLGGFRPPDSIGTGCGSGIEGFTSSHQVILIWGKVRETEVGSVLSTAGNHFAVISLSNQHLAKLKLKQCCHLYLNKAAMARTGKLWGTTIHVETHDTKGLVFPLLRMDTVDGENSGELSSGN